MENLETPVDAFEAALATTSPEQTPAVAEDVQANDTGNEAPVPAQSVNEDSDSSVEEEEEVDPCYE